MPTSALSTAALACWFGVAGATGELEPGATVVDCYLRTNLEPATCGQDPRFELLQLLPNKSWSAPDEGVNCCCGRGGSAVRGAPEPFGLGIPLAACERGCEGYTGCTGITVTKPYNSSCEPSHVQNCPDLCAGAPTQCSPEICDLKPGQLSRLKPGTYYHNRQIFLPEGSGIIGAGINKTYIVACGRQLASGCNMTERRGFLMGDNTYVGNFSFTGRENKRSGCPLGGGMIETPGCQGDYCGLHKNPPPGAPLCNPPGRNLAECTGINNATAEYIHLHAWTMDHVGWFPPTVPWGPDQTSGSTMITLRHLTSWGSYADGINFHGGHKLGLVEGCEISYTGDDLYAHWPQSTFRPGFETKHDPRDCSDHIIFRNNIGRYPRFGTGPSTICGTDCSSHPNPCFSLWGSGANMAIIDNHCEEADGPVGMHSSYTNTKNIQMWCGPIAVDGNSYANEGYCSSTHCQAEGDDRICYSAGSWPTEGTLGGDAGCNRSSFQNKTVPHASLPSNFRQQLWKGFPSFAFPEVEYEGDDDEASA